MNARGIDAAGARIPDWRTARAEIVPRLRLGDFAGGAWVEKGKPTRHPVPAFNAHAISRWHVRAVRDGAFLALEEARTAQGELAHILLAVANALDLLTVEADTLCGAIHAQGMGGAGFVRGRLVRAPLSGDDDFDPEEKTIAELRDIVAGLPQQTARALRDVADGVNRQVKEIERLRRTVRGEDTAGRNGGRPRKPGAEKMILRVIQCATEKTRPKRSHYADHVFRNWKGERPYISAHSLFTSARRYLADNGLPDLPTTAAAQADFVRAVNGNAVILRKLEAHKPR